MLKPTHSRWARLIFYPYIAAILRRDFSRFWLTGTMPDIPDSSAVLATPNHIGWWDGFFMHHINRTLLHKNFYLMILEEQLSIHWYFRHLGVYSIKPGDRKDIRESLVYTRTLLNKKDSMVVLYPEGELSSQFNCQLDIKGGVKYLSRQEGNSFSVLPAVFIIQTWDKRKPEIICGFGNAIPSGKVAADYSAYKAHMEHTLSAVKKAAETRDFSAELFGREKVIGTR